MRLVAGIGVVILALSPLAYGAARGRRRRRAGAVEERPRAAIVLEGLIVLVAAVLGIVIAVAVID